MHPDSFTYNTLIWWLIFCQCSYRLSDVTKELNVSRFFFIVICFFTLQPFLYNRDCTNKGTCRGKLPSICRHVGCLETGLKLCVADGWSSALRSPSGANARATGHITSARLFNTSRKASNPSVGLSWSFLKSTAWQLHWKTNESLMMFPNSTRCSRSWSHLYCQPYCQLHPSV